LVKHMGLISHLNIHGLKYGKWRIGISFIV
jgi:hypothetical protein